MEGQADLRPQRKPYVDPEKKDGGEYEANDDAMDNAMISIVAWHFLKKKRNGGEGESMFPLPSVKHYC